MTTEEQLAFALAQAEFWRLRYLSAKNVTDKELEFVVRRVTATAVKEEREACAKACESLLDEGEDSYVVNRCLVVIRARGAA